MTVRTTVSNDGDLAYIYLTEIGPGEAAKTYTIPPPAVPGGAMINLDFDKDDRLVGIEVIGRNKLPESLLKEAEIIG